jgi:hypothetical protein
MEDNNKKPWYKRGLVIVILGIVGASFIAGLADNTSTPQNSTGVYNSVVSQPLNRQAVPPEAPVVQKKFNTVTPVTDSGLSNSNYYINTAGNQVHSPAYSNSVPVGASAQCRDGTYSFSQSRKGTCSHHGGVARWL